MSGNAANATESFATVARQLQWRNAGLPRCPHPDPNHLSAAVEVDTHRLPQIGTDGGQPLSKLWCCDVIARQPLMVKAAQLFELIGFQAAQIAMNGLDESLSSAKIDLRIILVEISVRRGGLPVDSPAVGSAKPLSWVTA